MRSDLPKSLLKSVALILTALGLAATLWLIGATGAAEVFGSVARIGSVGFLTMIVWTGVNLCILGAAWLAVAPGIARGQLGTFAWARTTREAATDLLPFSQIGGLLVGAHTATRGGIRASLVYASLIADQTTELAAQLVFSLFGIALLLIMLSDGSAAVGVLPLALGGGALMLAIMAGFTFAQRPLIGMAEGLARRLLPAAVASMNAMRLELDAIYRERGRVITAFLLHLVAWVFGAAGSWVALNFMGVSIGLGPVLMVEALIFTLRTVAFAIPGGIGVQEGAYVLLAPLIGLPPETALALSLIKRARDIVIAVPTLLIWQVGEARRVVS